MKKSHKRKLSARKYYPEAYLGQRKTHPGNRDMTLYYDTHYEGFPLLTLEGPLIYPYLKQLIYLVDQAFTAYSKVYAVRFELYFPSDWTEEQRLGRSEGNQSDRSYFELFIASLKERLKVLQKNTGYSLKVDLDKFYYAAAVEFGEKKYNRGMHIHVLLLLNGQRFQSLGVYDSNRKAEALTKKTVSTLVREAWASALFGYDRSPDKDFLNEWQKDQKNPEAVERVTDEHLAYFSSSWSDKGPDNRLEHIYQIIEAGSYLCKAHTKQFNKGIRPFRTSHLVKLSNERPYSADPNQYHKGNPLLQLYSESSFNDMPLDTLASPYIEPDLEDLWRLMNRAKDYFPYTFMVTLQIPIPNEALRLKRSFSYVVKFLKRIKKEIGYRFSSGQLGEYSSTKRVLGAYAFKRSSDGSNYAQIALFMNGLMAEFLFKDDQEDYLVRFFESCYGKAYSNASRVTSAELEVSSTHELSKNHDGYLHNKKLAFKHLAYLSSTHDHPLLISAIGFYDSSI